MTPAARSAGRRRALFAMQAGAPDMSYPASANMPPGLRNACCMSTTITAVRARSIWRGSGLAAMVVSRGAPALVCSVISISSVGRRLCRPPHLFQSPFELHEQDILRPLIKEEHAEPGLL